MKTVLQEIEESIVCQLRPLQQCGFEIQATPEVQADMEKPASKPRIWVTYRESERAESRSLSSFVSQERTITFQLTFQARVLRNQDGIYKLMSSAESLLMGFKPPHCDRITLKNDRFDTFENNTWRWILDISVKGLQNQELTDEEIGPLIREITFVEE